MISVENLSNPSKESFVRPSTGIVHRFKNAVEFIQIKSMEIGSVGKNIIAEAFRSRFRIEEPCTNRLCGAPPQAHVMVGT